MSQSHWKGEKLLKILILDDGMSAEKKAAEEMKIGEFNIIQRYVTQFIRANKHPTNTHPCISDDNK
jgi:hypothetical protein